MTDLEMQTALRGSAMKRAGLAGLRRNIGLAAGNAATQASRGLTSAAEGGVEACRELE